MNDVAVILSVSQIKVSASASHMSHCSPVASFLFTPAQSSSFPFRLLHNFAMGNSHHYWVIAKVNGRYRTFAIAKLGNCADTDAIHGCYRLLQIFGSSRNRTLLSHDLKHAARQDATWWNTHNEESSPSFPFVNTCLYLGATFDSRLDPYPYVYPAILYNFQLTPMELLVGNQNGCTIVDITDLRHLRYCFMFYPSTIHDPIMKKIAKEHEEYGFDPYRYCTEEEKKEIAAQEEQDKQFQATKDVFRCRPFDADKFLTWPGFQWAKIGEYENLSEWDMIDEGTLRDLWPEIPWPEDAPRQSQEQNIQPKELTLDDDEKSLSNQEWLRRVRSDNAFDFSAFPRLPEAAVSQLLEFADHDDDITRVDLSGHQNVSLELLSKLLDKLPNLTVLSLMHTSLPIPSLFQLLCEKGARTLKLYHNDLFSAAFTSPPCPDDETQGPLVSLPNYHAPSGSLNRIVFLSNIMENDILKPKRKRTRESETLPVAVPRLASGGLQWSSLLSPNYTSYRCDDQSLFFADIPLHDAFLDPGKLSSWLPRLLWFFATNGATNDRRSLRPGHTVLGTACALAMDVDDEWSVGPVPGTAPLLRMRFKDFEDLADSMDPVGSEGWTLLVVNEDGFGSRWYTRDCTAVRYVFVKRDSERGEVLTCGPGEFYARTTGNLAVEEGMYVPEGVRHLVKACERDEVDEVFGPFREKRERIIEERR